MILEYLFSNPKSEQENIKKYTEKNNSIHIEFEIKDIKESNLWISTFKTKLSDDQSALTLSKINEDITGTYPEVLTLTNEAAAYYNKILYPLINKFERDLRKLLYLASKLSGNSSDSKSISNLEKMDFGNLFDLIFTDKDFITTVKATINNKSWNYSKDELVNSLKEIQENTLWNKLIGAEIAPILQKNYISIKNYRNNVMHAHNITTKDYSTAKNIYSTVTKELETAINNIINNEIKFNNIQYFNSAMLEAINFEKINNLITVKNVYSEYFDQIINKLDTPAMNALREQTEQINIILETPAMNAFREQTEQITDILDTPVMNALRKQTEQIKDILDTPAMNAFNANSFQKNAYSLIYGDLIDLKSNIPTTIKSNVYEEQGFELNVIIKVFQKLLDLKIITGSIDKNKNLYIEKFQD